MPQITKRLEFDAGHRVLGHEGKCKALHGHRYVAEITVSSPNLDSISRVVDFSVIKTEVGGWIDKNLDHNLILNEADPLVRLWADFQDATQLRAPDASFWKDKVFAGKEPFLMPVGENPTAECLAELLFHKAQELLPKLRVVNVRLFETPTSSSDFPGTADCPLS